MDKQQYENKLLKEEFANKGVKVEVRNGIPCFIYGVSNFNGGIAIVGECGGPDIRYSVI